MSKTVYSGLIFTVNSIKSIGLLDLVQCVTASLNNPLGPLLHPPMGVAIGNQL